MLLMEALNQLNGDQTCRLDEWIGKKVFSPILDVIFCM